MLNEVQKQMKIDMYDISSEFKNKLKNEGVVGVFCKTCDPAFIEVLGYAGADYVIIDLEHGPNTIQNAQNLIRGAEVSGILPIVRVKESYESIMSEALDIGAGGIQVPQITSKKDALEVMERTKFSPAGNRGVCRFVRAADYSAKNRFEYFEEANETLTVLQIEGQEGIDNIDEILQVDGIDVLFIGPYDLSQSLGVPGDIDNPIVEEKMLEIINKCSKRNVIVGTFTDTLENAIKWKRLGVKYISHSVDVGIFFEAAENIINKIKK
jgi:4-hydroxy-2-oxoheptanedioate aldolase